MILTIANEKGGSGKSTLAINISSKFVLEGYKTMLLDTDPQMSVKSFLNVRVDAGLPMIFNSIAKFDSSLVFESLIFRLNSSSVDKFGSSLKQELQEFKTLYDVVIIDTSGRDAKDARMAIIASDFLLIPTIASHFDISALEHMLNIVEDVQIYNKNIKTAIVCNRISPNPFLQKDILNLKEFIHKKSNEKNLKNIKLLDSVIYERQAYKRNISEGKSLDEFCASNDKALTDFNAFFKEMKQYFNKFKLQHIKSILKL